MTFVGTAVKSYLVDKRAQQLSPDTLKKLECIFYRLVDWCNQNNVSTLNELDVTKLREWRAGVSIYDVSLLLGHSSVRTTERHYAPFVALRQTQLVDDVRRAW